MALRRGRSGEFVCFAIVQLTSAGPTGGVVWRRDKRGFLDIWAPPHRLTHNWVVGRSKSAPATIETLVGACPAIVQRRLTSAFAFGLRSKIGVSQGFFSGPTQPCPVHHRAGWHRARGPHAAPSRSNH